MKYEDDLEIKLCGKRLYPTEIVKYLGVKIDTNLLMIFLLDWIEPMLSFSKWENMLVLEYKTTGCENWYKSLLAISQGSQHSAKMRKIRENFGKLEKSGETWKTGEMSWKIIALRENSEEIFKLPFNLLIL